MDEMEETLRQVNSTNYYRYKILWFLNTYLGNLKKNNDMFVNYTLSNVFYT